VTRHFFKENDDRVDQKWSNVPKLVKEIIHKTSLEMQTITLINEPKLLKIEGGSLLNMSYLYLLCGFLSVTHIQRWKLLYSSQNDGISFNRFCYHVYDRGPTIVLIKEKSISSRLFGAYCNDSWKKSARFYGTANTFLFSLSPEFKIYKATGINQNFMYCNSGSQQFPNGFGFGGQLEYFALFVASDFERGYSKDSTCTFNSPVLSSSENFEVDKVEVWGCGADPIEKK